ncbi:zinc finger, CCHC-type containing protein [Tanacetum coccineum]
MNVKTTFLNGHLYEDVYIEDPEGFQSSKYPERVCKLQRSVYGLKQRKEKDVKVPYASAIGSIMYVNTCTTPDVSYALSMTSRFQADPGEEHWAAANNILRYLRRTNDIFWFMEKFIEELGVVSRIENPAKVYCDNSSTTQLANECITQRGNRHILCIHHYICEAVSLHNVEVIKIHTDDNTADSLTKALLCDKNEFHVNGMGLPFVGLNSS